MVIGMIRPLSVIELLRKQLILCLERAVSYAEVVQGRPDLGLDKPVRRKAARIPVEVPKVIPHARDALNRNGRIFPRITQCPGREASGSEW